MNPTTYYLQGGPCDLQKIVIDGPRRPEIYMASLAQPMPLEGVNLQDAARQVEVTKHIYRAVGGYSVQGRDIVTCAYAGPLSTIVL